MTTTSLSLRNPLCPSQSLGMVIGNLVGFLITKSTSSALVSRETTKTS